MNCKPGELGIVVDIHGASPANKRHIGKIVTAVERHPDHPECWVTDPVLDDLEDDEYYFAPDDTELRPLRDSEGTDETLTWAPVPHKETA